MIHGNRIKIFDYSNILKILIVAFFVVLVIQQIEYVIGIKPVFNELGTENWRLNSLSLEPSLTGMIVNILFYSLYKTKEIIANKKYTAILLFREQPLISLMYLYTIFTCGSSFGLLFFFIILIHFIKPSYIVIMGILVSLLFVVLYINNFSPIVRIYNMFIALLTLDKSVLLQTDLGAGIRIYPVFQYLESFSLFNAHTWFGKGMAYNSMQITEFLGEDGIGSYGWFFPSFLVDHGVFAFCVLLYVFFKNAFFGIFKVETLLFVIMLINTSLNTQVFWFGVIFFTINKYFYMKNYQEEMS